MTLLMFDQYEQHAVIFTDTLKVNAKNDPAGHRSKVFPFPHLNMVMTVTGISEVADLWAHRFDRIESRVDIEDVAKNAPVELKQVYADLEQHYRTDLGGSTIYLFGFPAGSDAVVRYRFSHHDDYAPWRHVATAEHDEGFAVKPPPQKPIADGLDLTTPAGAIAIATQVRAENGDGKQPDTVPIGGDLFATILRNGSIVTEKIHTFPQL